MTNVDSLTKENSPYGEIINLPGGFKVTLMDELPQSPNAVDAVTVKVYILMFRFFAVRLVASGSSKSTQSDRHYYNIDTCLRSSGNTGDLLYLSQLQANLCVWRNKTRTLLSVEKLNSVIKCVIVRVTINL